LTVIGGEYEVFTVIDTHAHLDELSNLELALSEAKEAGLAAIIAVGSNLRSNQKVMEISQRHRPLVYAALGLHPWELGNLEPHEVDDTLAFIEDRAEDIVAVGEIGLDYHKRVVKVASKELQKAAFKRLLELARSERKPVIIHSRYAWKDCLDMAKEAAVEKAVFHWFTGFSSVLRDLLNAGYLLSATPAAEYHEEHRRAVRETPAERLLLETDCPVEYGKGLRYRSQPSDILRSLKAAAALKGMDESDMAKQTTANAARFFGLEIQ
jgi:TatD DNase family protein